MAEKVIYAVVDADFYIRILEFKIKKKIKKWEDLLKFLYEYYVQHEKEDLQQTIDKEEINKNDI